LKFLGESILHIGSVASSSIFLPGGTFLRGYGTFPHPNILGAFLVIVLAASLNEILMKKNGRPRLALTICSGLMTLIVAGGIFLTFSRIAWLCGLFIVLLFTGFVLFRYRRKILPYFLVSVSVVIVLGISWMNLSKRPLAENLRERIVEQSMGSDYSMSERREFNEQAIKLIKKSPLIGNGLGRYIVSAKDMPIYNNYGVRLMQPVHNVFLLILSEVGVLGVVCLTAVVVLALIQNRSASRRTQKFKPSPFLLISFIPLFVLASLFDHYLWTLPQGLTLWILAVYLLRAQGQVQGSTLR
jgi:O-antigen ligase